MRGKRLRFCSTMANTCPDCGEAIELTDREVRLRTGTCGACHHEFTLVAGAALPIPEGAAVGGVIPSAAAPEPPEGGPECADCGGPLLFRARSDGSLEARCDECETTAIYVVRGAPSEERTERRPRAPSFDRDAGGGLPRGRPCRQCGAPLRFTTNDEGSLVGECDACGNRFTLPPRSDSPRGPPRYGGGGRPGGRRFGPPRGRPSYGGSPRGGPRRYGRDREGSDEGSDQRRRRRRSDE